MAGCQQRQLPIYACRQVHELAESATYGDMLSSADIGRQEGHEAAMTKTAIGKYANTLTP